LRQARMEARLSQDAAAERVRVTRQAVGQWESGATAISAVQVGLLGALYGVSADWLIFGLRTVPVDEGACKDCSRSHSIMRMVLERHVAPVAAPAVPAVP